MSNDAKYRPVTKMIVHNLSPQTTVKDLSELFADFGVVRSISLATDVMTGRCGGFGYVCLHEQDAGAAYGALQGRCVDGHVLRLTLEHKAGPHNYYG